MESSGFKKIEQLANNFIKFNEINGVQRLYEKLQKILSEMNSHDLEFLSYQKLIIKLKTFIIQLFEEDDYFDLIKNNFEVIYTIPDYDLWEKVKILLMNIYDFNKRNELKNKFKQILIDCRRPITINQYPEDDFPRNVSDWIKDFVSNFGPDKIDVVKKHEYLLNGKFIKILKIEDRERVRGLLDFYEKLVLSSNEREGMENSVPMDIDGQFFILNEGEIENLNNYSKIINNIKVSDLTTINKETSILKISNNKERSSELDQLQKTLANYQPNSLEYKAIQQEIERLKKSNNQK